MSTGGPIVVPGASWSVDPDRTTAPIGTRSHPAVEMTAPWKPQTGFHRALEISHRPRDSHIPTSRSLSVYFEEDEEEDQNVTRDR